MLYIVESDWEGRDFDVYTGIVHILLCFRVVYTHIEYISYREYALPLFRMVGV